MRRLDLIARRGHHCNGRHDAWRIPERTPAVDTAGTVRANAGDDMARHELLDNVVHKDLRVDTRFGAGLGDPAGLVPVWPTEFAELQREYPIFLQKGEGESEYHAVALLGFDASENLFLDGDRWNANYLPGAVVRGPFSIGFRDPVPGGSLEPEPVVHVDMEHPRVARDGEGVAVFMPKGGHSPYLDHVITVLKGIHDGVAAARAMFATLDRLGLLQPVDLDVRFDEARGARVTGLYGIDRDRLAALEAGQLHALHRDGLLEGVYLMLASLYNMRRLIAEKQRRLRAQDGAGAAA